MGRVNSVAGVLENTHSGEDFCLEKNEFLDAFYLAGQGERGPMLATEPVRYAGIPDWQYAFAAAMAHMLARSHGLEVPSWVFGKGYYLDEPEFGGFDSPELRMLMMVESPPEFLHRNIYAFDNVLTRA